MADLLTGVLPPVPLRDQIACVEREIALRRRVYPHWVEAKRMTQSTADEEIRRMDAVLATLRGLQP
jgi:hypothetical protein